MKFLERFEKKLTIDFINQFLRRKGIATSVVDKDELTFKLYDQDWDIVCDSERFCIRKQFGLGKDIDVHNLMLACNAVNTDRWVVKSRLLYDKISDENEVDYTSQPSGILFSYDCFCYRASDFEKLYEFGIFALADSIDYHGKVYNACLEANKKLKDTAQKIGFVKEAIEEGDVPTAKSNTRKIGFV